MKWSEQELQQLRELYPTMPRRQIAERLQRPTPSVVAMIYALKLTKRQPPRQWSHEEAEALRRLYPALGPHECAKLLERPVPGVKAMAYRLGLRMEVKPGELPLGTERMFGGYLYRKVSLDRRGLENWQPVSRLEESPGMRDLYRLLESINRQASALAKKPPSPSCASTC